MMTMLVAPTGPGPVNDLEKLDQLGTAFTPSYVGAACDDDHQGG